MNIDQSWLKNNQLASLGARPLPEELRRAVWRSKYVPTCPSECYRGSATVLYTFLNGLQQGAGVNATLDEIDRSLRSSKLPIDDNLSVGAFIALMSSTRSAENAPNLAFLIQCLDMELTCIAQFFFENVRRGI